MNRKFLFENRRHTALLGTIRRVVPSADLGAGVRQRNVVIGELLSMSSCMSCVVLCSLSAPATVLSYSMAQEWITQRFGPVIQHARGQARGRLGGHDIVLWAQRVDFEA